jgi:hypothetical protein
VEVQESVLRKRSAGVRRWRVGREWIRAERADTRFYNAIVSMR